MSDFKFSCSFCGQTIQCDELFSGLEIKCPACAGDIVVPQSSPVAEAPAPPPKGPIRIALRPVGEAAHAADPPPSPPPAPQSALRNLAQLQDTWAEPKPSIAKKVLTIGVLTVVLGGAGYFLFTGALSLQSKMDSTREKAKEEGGGELGHIASLYQALDATDPAKITSTARFDEDDERVDRIARAQKNAKSADPFAGQPITPAVWTLDATVAKIPAGKANGSISGSNFVADTVLLSRAGASYVLALRHGTNQLPDREVLVYLRPKPGQALEGGNWTVSADVKSGAPQVAKRWKPQPKGALQQRFFSGGYAMKLEFGKADDEYLPGKIFLALPDPEKTVVAGNFIAELRLPLSENQAYSRTSSDDE